MSISSLGVVRAIFADLDAVRDELDHVADERNVGAETSSLRTIDVDLPFDPRKRPRIVYVVYTFYGFQCITYASRCLCKDKRVARRKFDLYRFALLRPVLCLAGLDGNPDEARGALADVGKNLVGRPALVPFDEVERNRADKILGSALAERAAAATATATTGFRIHTLDFVQAEDVGFDLANEEVFFIGAEIAARFDVDGRPFRLHFGEQLESTPEQAERRVGPNQNYSDDPDVSPRRTQRAFQKLNVFAGQAADLVEVAGFRQRQVPARLVAHDARRTEHRTECRHEQQGHQQRRRQYCDQRNRQVLHELAHFVRPERQRNECRECRAGRRNDRPGHTPCSA